MMQMNKNVHACYWHDSKIKLILLNVFKAESFDLIRQMKTFEAKQIQLIS